MAIILEMADGLVVNFSRGFKMKNYSHFEKLLIVLANLILIGSVLLALSFAFNYNGFRDSFQSWYEIALFFWLIFLAPSLPSTLYEWYESIRDALLETHELNQEQSMSEKEVYLFHIHTPKPLSFPQKLLHLIRRNF